MPHLILGDVSYNLTITPAEHSTTVAITDQATNQVWLTTLTPESCKAINPNHPLSLQGFTKLLSKALVQNEESSARYSYKFLASDGKARALPELGDVLCLSISRILSDDVESVEILYDVLFEPEPLPADQVAKGTRLDALDQAHQILQAEVVENASKHKRDVESLVGKGDDGRPVDKDGGRAFVNISQPLSPQHVIIKVSDNAILTNIKSSPTNIPALELDWRRESEITVWGTEFTLRTLNGDGSGSDCRHVNVILPNIFSVSEARDQLVETSVIEILTSIKQLEEKTAPRACLISGIDRQHGIACKLGHVSYNEPSKSVTYIDCPLDSELQLPIVPAFSAMNSVPFACLDALLERQAELSSPFRVSFNENLSDYGRRIAKRAVQDLSSVIRITRRVCAPALFQIVFTVDIQVPGWKDHVSILQKNVYGVAFEFVDVFIPKQFNKQTIGAVNSLSAALA